MKSKREPCSPLRTGAAYIRVSTDDQMELSPESQLSEIKRYASDHNITIPSYNIFIEKEGRSGKKAGNRPEFQRMIACAKSIPKPFEVILVWKFSRFARNQDESTFYKGMLRKKLSIDIISVSEPIMEGMYGRLIELIIEWQDEFYSYNLGMEVIRGMKENAQRGAYQAPPPLGYQYLGKGTVPAVIEKEARLIKEIFTLFTRDKKDLSSIAKDLNSMGAVTKKGKPFTPRGLIYILNNPFYVGDIRWNRASHGCSFENPEEEIIVTAGRHEAIVDRNTFEKARELLQKQKINGSRDSSQCRHWLVGILSCPRCSAALSYQSSGKGGFQCWRYTKGLHTGSSYISLPDATEACLRSLEGVTKSHLASDFLSDDSVPLEIKGNLLRTLLYQAVFDRAENTFCFYYYI